MFKDPGILNCDTFNPEHVRAGFLTGPASRSLLAAAKEYELINPFIFPLCLPNSPIDLMSESMRVTGAPARLIALKLPYTAFDYGKNFGDFTAMCGHILVAIPRHEWEVVRQFLLSVLMLDPAAGSGIAVRLGKVVLRDPFLTAVTSLTKLTDNLVSVWTVNLEHADSAVVFVRKPHWPANPQYEMRRFKLDDPDFMSQEVCAEFLRGGSNPLIHAENVHGHIDFETGRHIQLADEGSDQTGDDSAVG